MKKIYLILFLALIIRLVSIDQSLWLDEATTALVSKELSWGQLFEFIKADFHPPLYYVIVKIFTQTFSNHLETFLRLPSVLAGLGTVFVVYKIGKIITKDKALLAAALLATAPLHIYYSQEARMYAAAALFVSLAFLFYLRKSYLLFVLALSASLWIDYMAVFVVPVFLIHSWFFDKSSFKKTSIFLAVVGLVCIPMVLFLKYQLSVGFSAQGSGWWQILGVTNFKNLALIPVKFLIGRISFDRSIYVFVLLVSGALVFRAMLGSIRNMKNNSITFLWLILPVLLAMVVGFFLPIVTYFRFLFLVPAFYLLIANGPRKIVYLILILNLIFSGIYLFNAKFHREDWRSAVALIETSPNKSQVVFPANSQMEAYKYYATKNNYSGPSGIDSSAEEIWLMRYVYDIVDPEDTTRREVESRGFVLSSEYNFNGVVVFKYENRN